MRNITRLTLAVAALVVTGTVAQAQTNNASITATALVLTPINVNGAQQLSFGNVFPGVNKSVAVADLTNAGRFDVTGQANAAVTLSFTLPACRYSRRQQSGNQRHRVCSRREQCCDAQRGWPAIYLGWRARDPRHEPGAGHVHGHDHHDGGLLSDWKLASS